MKKNRTKIFIIISSISLIILLIIQVNWILHTAKIKEDLFNEKANMVLSKTADALITDKETYSNLATANMVLSKKVNVFPNPPATINTNLPSQVSEEDTHKIDSLFNYFMKLYNIHIDYFFEIKAAPNKMNNKTAWTNSGATLGEFKAKKETMSSQPEAYQTCIGGDLDKNNLELKLVFPDKEQFIIAEMGTMFITSVILIMVILILFWQTILSLIKEKKIGEHTTDFLNNMTHEFKTPLTNIALAGKMLIKNSTENKPNKITHYSTIILQENEKLRLQVEEVLSMTALERGEIPLQKTELDFHLLINDALKCMELQIENKQGIVFKNLLAKKCMVLGDKTHLTNALCNLIDNAIKYSNGTPTITIQTSNLDNNLAIAVSDIGIGIEKEYQKKVFHKFFRVPTGNVHNVKGFGLGLAYIKKIITLHNGTIELKSEPNKETIFTIIIPNV